ncbi:hypothetical protein [Micromonospora sp. NPDC048843]|uniref:hypothetical protein n=1 Tax=Micromonospora sp. NPDC048843 TaxID=3155389 RepID=UPI0033C7436B
MKRTSLRLVRQIDAIVALLLAVVTSTLGLLDVVSPKIAGNATLATLAVISFALLRDRWNKASADRSTEMSVAMASQSLTQIERRMASLEAASSAVLKMQTTVEGIAHIRTVRGADIAAAFSEARQHTDRWLFRGGTGTYTRAVTLPECIANARRDRRALLVRIEIIDPTSSVLCEAYSRFRHAVSSRPDGTGELWTADRTMRESYATILSACYHQQRFQFLDISIGLSTVMSTFRFDLSASRVIITQDDPQFPAMVVSNGSPLFDGYANDLRTTMAQAKRVDLEAAARTPLSDEPTVTEARALFVAVGVPLPKGFDDVSVREVIDKAIRAKNPYE